MATTLARAYQDGWNDALRTVARRVQNEASDMIAHPPTNPYAPQFKHGGKRRDAPYPWATEPDAGNAT